MEEKFIQIYPEFAEVDGDRLGIFIEHAKMEVSQKAWGKLYERGLLALTAHLLRLNQMATKAKGDANRPLASESAGEPSVSYQGSTITGVNADYQLTAYGQEYLRLRKLVGVGVMVV